MLLFSSQYYILTKHDPEIQWHTFSIKKSCRERLLYYPHQLWTPEVYLNWFCMLIRPSRWYGGSELHFDTFLISFSPNPLSLKNSYSKLPKDFFFSSMEYLHVAEKKNFWCQASQKNNTKIATCMTDLNQIVQLRAIMISNTLNPWFLLWPSIFGGFPFHEYSVPENFRHHSRMTLIQFVHFWGFHNNMMWVEGSGAVFF